jgi:hypothetical protein
MDIWEDVRISTLRRGDIVKWSSKIKAILLSDPKQHPAFGTLLTAFCYHTGGIAEYSFARDGTIEKLK